MPKITGIETAKRRSGWVEIQLDGASSFLLPQDTLLALGLSGGDVLEDAEVRRLESEAERAEAMRIALRYLSVRPRSRRELADRLREKGVGGAAGDHVLRRCEELGYLDDVAFAAAYARDRIRLRPCGRRRLMSDLRRNGVSETDATRGIAAAMDEERVDEPMLLDRVARARVSRLSGVAPEVAGRRLFAFLARRGFDASGIRAWIDAELDITEEPTQEGR
ncbi:MAG: regulatory protein RecX [Gemmatimonadota bacterium]|nr:regulatory protein RecX [Gemmatimonadota bacterium]